MTSTSYPAEYPIQFHNEFSYARTWPQRIFFCCTSLPTRGGETPIADVRKVLARLEPATRERFERHGVLYQRNYRDGMGVSWRTAFGTEQRDEVDRRTAALGVESRWCGDVLRTRHRAPAVVRHPETLEPVWFNHCFFFNVLSLEPQELRDFMACEPESDRSTNTYYGDGTAVSPEIIEAIRQAYAAERREFTWERGDVLLIDNMLTAHARSPYVGPRQVLVVLADAVSRDRLPIR